MKRIIENLISANLFAYEQIGHDSDETKSIVKAINENRQALVGSFTEEQKEIFYIYEDLSNERLTLREISMFAEGFKLGAKILIDVLSDETSIL